MRKLVNLIAAQKHLISGEEMDEMIIHYLNIYVKLEPNDADLGAKMRAQVNELSKLLIEIKPIREKQLKID